MVSANDVMLRGTLIPKGTMIPRHVFRSESPLLVKQWDIVAACDLRYWEHGDNMYLATADESMPHTHCIHIKKAPDTVNATFTGHPYGRGRLIFLSRQCSPTEPDVSLIPRIEPTFHVPDVYANPHVDVFPDDRGETK